jgi:hypothetical protein
LKYPPDLDYPKIKGQITFENKKHTVDPLKIHIKAKDKYLKYFQGLDV